MEFRWRVATESRRGARGFCLRRQLSKLAALRHTVQWWRISTAIGGLGNECYGEDARGRDRGAGISAGIRRSGERGGGARAGGEHRREGAEAGISRREAGQRLARNPGAGPFGAGLWN